MNILIIEAANEHDKIFAINFSRSIVARDCRHLKRSLLEPAVPDRQAVTIPVEHFQLVAPSIDEQNQVTRKRILAQDARYEPLQIIESFPHIGRRRGDEDVW